MSHQPLQPLGALLSRTFAFYRAHLRYVLLVAFPVVAFVDIALGIGLGEMTAGVHKNLPPADGYIAVAADELITVPIVTAILARAIVIERREGALPSLARAAEQGLELFAPALLVVTVYWVGVGLGSFLIILAAYWFVSWFFAVQAVVIDGARGFGAIVMSGTLVRGHWWHTAGVVLALELLSAIPGLIVTNLTEALAVAVDSDAVVVVGSILVFTLALPFVATGATFYYLELRERAQMPAAR
jgi:hypothetical protein